MKDRSLDPFRADTSSHERKIEPTLAGVLAEGARLTREHTTDVARSLERLLRDPRLVQNGRLPWLENAVLPGVDLSGKELPMLNAAGAYLAEAKLYGANLERATFENAILSRARLDGAVLIGACFRGASLQEAYLERADARGANFTGANLFRANFRQTRLEGACLAGAAAGTADFQGAHFDEKTILPNGHTLGAFINDVLPHILTSRGARLSQIITRERWTRTYPDRLLLEVFGPNQKRNPEAIIRFNDSSCHEFAIPPEHASDTDLFVKLFKAGVIPFSRVQHLA